MNAIKSIVMSHNKFIIESDNSPLKLNYSEVQDKFIVDISHMNLFQATKIAILCSTYCFINGFEKKLCWVVKDEQIKKAISILRLCNMEQIVKDSSIQKRAVFA